MRHRYGYRNKLTSFAYVRKEDDGDIHDFNYVFVDDLDEETHGWKKWKGE